MLLDIGLLHENDFRGSTIISELVIHVLHLLNPDLFETLHFVNNRRHVIIFKCHCRIEKLLDFQIGKYCDFDKIPVALVWISFIGAFPNL